MKNKTKANIFWLIIAIIVSISVFAYNDITDDEWCTRHMPQFNFSDNSKISYCYNEGWGEYCKVSYPEYCPKNDYSDYERCVRNCIVYGMTGDDCPCTRD